MNRVDEIYAACPNPGEFAQKYAAYIGELLAALDSKAVARVIELFLAARETGNRIFFIGNGGSAATASHFANDIAIGTRSSNKPFKAISLTDNNAVMTAIANDDGYDQLFVKQLEVLMEPGDLVVAISASGNSPNLLKAVAYAKTRGNHTIGLVGFDGGELARHSDTVIQAVTRKGEYGPVEDIHMILDHLISNYLFRAIRA